MSGILGILLIGFIAVSAFAILGIALMFLLKSEKWQKRALYLTAAAAVIITVNYAGMTPFYMVGDLVAAALIGGLAIVGVLVERLAKDENRVKRFKLAKILVSASAIASMILMMYF